MQWRDSLLGAETTAETFSRESSRWNEQIFFANCLPLRLRAEEEIVELGDDFPNISALLEFRCGDVLLIVVLILVKGNVWLYQIYRLKLRAFQVGQ